MKKYDFAAGVRYFYALNGFNLEITSNIYFKIVLWILCAINLITINFFFLYESLQSYNITFAQVAISKIGLFHFWLFYHALILKITKIGILISMIGIHLNDISRKRCYYISLIVFIFTMISSSIDFMIVDEIVQGSLHMKNSLGLGNSEFSKIFSLIFKLIEYFKWNWPMGSDMIYLAISYSLYRAKSNILSSLGLQNQVFPNDRKHPKYLFSNEKTYSKNQIYSIQKACGKIIRLHESFESAFSIFPFLTISNLFFSLSQKIYLIRNEPDNAFSKWVALDAIIKIINSLCVILLTNHFTNKLKQTAHEICEKIESNNQLELFDKFVLISKINHCLNLPITAWRMFNIDSSLILSFLSSTVTFTILFIS